MSNKEQKIESLGHLEAWLNDALNSGATSKEVYDTIANTIKDEINGELNKMSPKKKII